MARKKKEPSKAIKFDVFLDGELFDSVFFYGTHTEEEVRRSLVHHDGYDSEIIVKMHEEQTA
jgi:hypothetical protein